MLLLLATTLVWAFLVAINFYGARLLFQQPQLLKKLGQLLLLHGPVVLLHLVLKHQPGATSYAAVPLLSSSLFLLLMLAGLPSKVGPKPLSASSLSPSFLPGNSSATAVFFTWLCPAFVSLAQALTLFK